MLAAAEAPEFPPTVAGRDVRGGLIKDASPLRYTPFTRALDDPATGSRIFCVPVITEHPSPGT